MLSAILSDMGNVLIRYEPQRFLDRVGVSAPEDRKLLLQEVFESPLWPRLDIGEMTEGDLEAHALPRLPQRLHEAARELIFRWNEPILPIPGMEELMRDCKAAGLKLYLVSNASLRQPSYWPQVPGSQFFDGAVVSAQYRCCKPSGEIYRIALDRFHLAPEECLFVDDMEANVQGAQAVGIPGFLFTGDAGALREKLLSLGVPLPQP